MLELNNHDSTNDENTQGQEQAETEQDYIMKLNSDKQKVVRDAADQIRAISQKLLNN